MSWLLAIMLLRPPGGGKGVGARGGKARVSSGRKRSTGEGRLLLAENKAKRTPRLTKAQLAKSGLKERTIVEVRHRGGKVTHMSGEEYNAWRVKQPRGSHRASFRSVLR